MSLSPVQLRTLEALTHREAGPAYLSNLVWPDHVALRKGMAPGTGLVRPMLAVLAKLKRLGLVEWYSPPYTPTPGKQRTAAPVVWRLTSYGRAIVER